MSYRDMSALATDKEFTGRLSSAVCEQAKLKNVADDYVSQAVLRSPEQGAMMFMPFVSTAPGFDDAYAGGGQEAITDNQILAAVQANWDDVAAAWTPRPPIPA